ncbi:MAG: sulfur carrier protein ThiS [Rikenellaceae bacterium]|nr:sulfur carrier protein ThiS [Rikenellaceae bacterium]
MMKVNVNNEEVVFDGTTVDDLIASLSISTAGCAVAVGTKIVPAASWHSFVLSDGDKITIIRATQGG